MVVATFTVWVALFTVGVAPVVWPNLGVYRAEPRRTDVSSHQSCVYDTLRAGKK